MWVEIICGLVIYKLFRRFFLGDADDFPDVGTGDSRILFNVANRLERLCGGKAYVGLRIPDADSGARLSIDVVLVTETGVIVIAVKNLSGFVEDGKNGSWVCLSERKHRPEVCPDPVAETMRQIEVLKTYLEQRGVVLPKGHLTSRVILPNPYCRVSQSINSLPEVVTHDKWEDFKPEGRSGLSSWIKDAFRGGKGEDGIYQKLRLILGTTPMWDRLELKGDKIILGEFLEFKGKQEDIQLLKSLKRSKVSQLVVQKSSLFTALGSSKLQLLYAARDYRNEGTSTSTSEWMEMQVKGSTELLFQPLNSKKTLRCGLSKVVSLSLSA
ncbi:hypothetical protein Taro_040597 [Colocasia esculenta]|uniref:NERD domain-containing protein n=1 Tax=Colocasia esculenta TaxID=4460 RepID=A0A843WJ65_COLES|nr:hypothetical protein [Colocasia esculenta]